MKIIKHKNCIVCGTSHSRLESKFCDLECELVYNSNKEAINNNREYYIF